MAELQKKQTSPTQVDAPQTLVPLMQAFHAEDEETANALILEAVNVISPTGYYNKDDPSKEDIELITALMRGLKPQDSLETLYCAQIIMSHLMGMRKLSSTRPDYQHFGLKILKFSNDAMKNFNDKRNKGNQTITVNYNNNGSGNANSQTIIKGK